MEVEDKLQVVEKESPTITKLSDCLVLIKLHEKGALNMSELAKELGFTVPRLSLIIDRLESYEYVKCNKSWTDERKVMIKLTRYGTAQALLARASLQVVPGRDEIVEKIIKMFRGAEKNEKA